MSWIHFFRRRIRDEESRQELESYLQTEIDRNMELGMPADEALRAARLKLGNVTRILEDLHVQNGIGLVEILWHDLRFGFRMLTKDRGFAAVAVLTLALGIGANTAIFSVVNGTLIRPLPYPNASRLALVWESKRPDGEKQNVTSPATFLNWQADNTVFDQMAAFYNDTSILTGGESPEQIATSGVSPNLFAMLGVNASMGRVFVPSQDGNPGADRVALLSFDLWQRRYGSDPRVLGSKIMMDDKPFTVVGVMPRGFQFFIKQQSFSKTKPEIWIPIAFGAKDRARHGRYLQALGLLRAGVTWSQAQSAMAGLATRLEAQDPASMKNWGINLVPLRTQLVGDIEPGLRLLLAAVGFVLLIACANVATLCLARATSRRQEIAIRMALGASTSRVVRQILTESCLIAIAGGVAGLVLGSATLSLMKVVAPGNLIPLESIHMDPRVLGFTAVVALLTGLLFGTVPAIDAARTSPQEPLQDGRTSAGSASRGRARRALVVTEVALALILLTGSSLMIRSFERLIAVDPGFRPQGILTASVQLPNAKYEKDERKSQFFAELLDRLRQLPNVRSASADAFLPFTGIIAGTGVDVEGRPKLPPSEQPSVHVALVEPEFFETMGIPLLKGRSFTSREGVVLSHKVVISSAMAKQLWPKEDPIGKRLTIYMKRDNTPSEVIGVVGDVKHAGLDEDVHPTAYWPYPELSFPFMTLVVRTDGDPAALASAVRQAVLNLDKDQPLADVLPLETLLSVSLARTRFATAVLAAFAGMALLLAMIGIYGLVAYDVEERTREIGIRMALGARRSSVMSMILKKGLTLVCVGIGLGTLASLALTRLITSMLFGIRANDPATFMMVAMMLAIVALLAGILATRRVSRIEPMNALRCD
jgi:putative ABC transport system permease protein